MGWARFSLWELVVAHSTLVFGVSYFLRFPFWWKIIQVFFLPALVVGFWLDLPSWLVLSIFLTLVVINLNSFRDRVPLYLSSQKANRAMETLLKNQKKDFRFVDLGSGFGGPLQYLSKRFPKAAFTGVETAPLNYLVSKFKLHSKDNCHLEYQDIWKKDLSEFDVVYAFLSPAPMQKLWEKAQREMRKGSLFVSNTFSVPGVRPEECVDLKDWRDGKLYIWRMK